MRKNGQLTDAILLALEKTADGLVRLEDFTYNTHLYKWGWDRPLKKSAFSQALYRLRKSGYIDKSLLEDKLIIKLTDKGKAQAIIRAILCDDKWDGRWRIVMFDIPEENKKVRDIFRSRLKLWEFQPLQKSVWATKKNVVVPLKGLLEELGIKRWVEVFEAEKI